MTDENPFGDVGREYEEEIARHLAMATEIDEMEADVTEWEQDFLESVLRQLRDEKRTLTPRQVEVLEEMYGRYVE